MVLNSVFLKSRYYPRSALNTTLRNASCVVSRSSTPT